MPRRLVSRVAVVSAAGSAALVLLAASAHANVSTFVGNAITDCDLPPASAGITTGFFSCGTTGTSTVCTTSVDAPEGSVVSPCVGNLEAAATPFFVIYRSTPQSAPVVACTGTGTGTFFYKPTPTSPIITIPVTVTVQGQTAEFGGAAVFGVNTTTVTGTYSAACGGFGTYAGQAL